LDLGAGTGKHAVRLAKKGVQVTGVKLSAEMVSLSPRHENLSMLEGDLSAFRSREKFNSCSAMFHVLSYMAGIDEMRGALKNAAAHLEPGGIFIFDVWHSPAVQNLGVEFRVKRVSLPGLEIVRLAEPSEDTQSKTVSVKYTLFIAKDGVKEYNHVTETHVLRHYDQQEVQSTISAAGMSLLGCFESFTGRPLNQYIWSACYVAAKN
jgi:2-polyprenyl-3-methyl-5-hydroxy-6-metoxy-1,4-benzoquinol methylase